MHIELHCVHYNLTYEHKCTHWGWGSSYKITTRKYIQITIVALLVPYTKILLRCFQYIYAKYNHCIIIVYTTIWLINTRALSGERVTLMWKITIWMYILLILLGTVQGNSTGLNHNHVPNTYCISECIYCYAINIFTPSTLIPVSSMSVKKDDSWRFFFQIAIVKPLGIYEMKTKS